MKKYKVKIYKYGVDGYDIISFKAKDLDHLFLLADNFCRKSTQYKEWEFIGEDDEV